MKLIFMNTKKLIKLTVCIILNLSFICLGEGFHTAAGKDNVPLVVVKGDWYQMGLSIGRLAKEDIGFLVSAILDNPQGNNPRYTKENLQSAWAKVSPHISNDWKQQLKGLSDGCGLPLEQLVLVHMIPVVDSYSCSGAAIWAKASKDGRMFVFRNLDFSLDMKMQDKPLIIVYIPANGRPFVNPTFSGFIGVQTGINDKGLALTEMGDSPDDEYPYNMEGVPFFTLFSDLLSQADSMDKALEMILAAKRIKKYHYVIGCGSDAKAVKIKAHAPDIKIWKDNDPNDESAPDIFENIVINAESRSKKAFEHIRKNYGQYDAQKVIELTKLIPIKGANLLAVVYDATDLKMYFAYARADQEAWKRDFETLDLKICFDYDKAQKYFNAESFH
jgi:hypothetical protein